MKACSLALMGLVLLVSLTGSPSEEGAQPTEPAEEEAKPALKRVYYIPLHGMIDNGLYTSLQRRMEIAEEGDTELIILEIDTYGGVLQSAFDICELIGDTKVKTVAYIPKKAISAGALIAIACNEMVMEPLSELGDCEPIIPSAEKGMITAPEKVQTKLRATFRKFAERNGYSLLLAEAMVTKDLTVYQVKTASGVQYVDEEGLEEIKNKLRRKTIAVKKVVRKGQLLTMTHSEALEYGFAKKIVKDKEELFAFYDVDPKTVVTLGINWSEEMVRFIDMIAPILIAVGFIAIYMELKMPGFGLPGFIAIMCFALVLSSKYLAGLAEEWEILLFFAGIALLAVEIFLIPGFGIIGITGLLLIALSLILAFQPVIVPSTPFEVKLVMANLIKVLGSITISIIGMCVLARYLPRTSMFRRIILAGQEKAEHGFVVRSPEAAKKFEGKHGVATSKLRPAGRAEIDGEIIDVVTEGEFIDAGKKIVVINTQGNRVVVKEV